MNGPGTDGLDGLDFAIARLWHIHFVHFVLQPIENQTRKEHMHSVGHNSNIKPIKPISTAEQMRCRDCFSA